MKAFERFLRQILAIALVLACWPMNAAGLGDYRLADETYRRLLEQLISKPDRAIPADLKQNLVEYFAGIGDTTRVEAKIRAQLQTLARMTTNP